MTDNISKTFIQASEEHIDALFRYCLFHVSDREMAKDIVQDTFMRTWNYIADGKEVRNMKAFLYETMRNLIIDYYRSKKTLSLDALAEDEHFDPPVREEVSIEEHAESGIAFKYLERIPKEYRKVVVMRYVKGLSFKEIARLTREAENTVAVRFHRALKKLKTLFLRERHI